MAARTIRGGIETYRRASDGQWTHGQLGDEVDVHEDDVERFDRLSFVAPEGDEVDVHEDDVETDEEPPEPYGGVTIPDLKAVIEERNKDREDADKIPATGNRPDLVAALVADDAKQQS